MMKAGSQAFSNAFEQSKVAGLVVGHGFEIEVDSVEARGSEIDQGGDQGLVKGGRVEGDGFHAGADPGQQPRPGKRGAEIRKEFTRLVPQASVCPSGPHMDEEISNSVSAEVLFQLEKVDIRDRLARTNPASGVPLVAEPDSVRAPGRSDARSRAKDPIEARQSRMLR